MSVSHKSSNMQLFRLMVYRRAIHPELLDLQGRRVYRHGDYEVECWLAPAGHVVRFQANGDIVTEAVIENGDHLPEHGLVHALPCLGEKDYELPRDCGVGYVTTVQTESLTDNLYLSTYREMKDFIQETNALSHEWREGQSPPSLSVLDAQKFKNEFHIQSYHLIGGTGLVLRTQSIFEII